MGMNKNAKKSRWDGNRSWTTAGASIMSTTLTVSQLACLPKCATNSIMSFFNMMTRRHLLKISPEQVQSEDPRLEWRALQEDMLRQYLVTAQEDLQVSRWFSELVEEN